MGTSAPGLGISMVFGWHVKVRVPEEPRCRLTDRLHSKALSYFQIPVGSRGQTKCVSALSGARTFRGRQGRPLRVAEYHFSCKLEDRTLVRVSWRNNE